MARMPGYNAHRTRWVVYRLGTHTRSIINRQLAINNAKRQRSAVGYITAYS